MLVCLAKALHVFFSVLKSVHSPSSQPLIPMTPSFPSLPVSSPDLCFVQYACIMSASFTTVAVFQVIPENDSLRSFRTETTQVCTLIMTCILDYDMCASPTKLFYFYRTTAAGQHWCSVDGSGYVNLTSYTPCSAHVCMCSCIWHCYACRP